MITLNLLPDIKREFLRSQRVKKLFILGAIMVSGVFVGAVVLLGLYIGSQKLHLNSVQSDIDESLAALQAQSELSKVVTIQKQLSSLPGLHEANPATDRLLGYLEIVVPVGITLSSVEIDFDEGENTAILSGAGPDPKAINVFVDTLKNANFNYDGNETPFQPFSDVVLESVSVGEEATSYQISLIFDSKLFDNTVNNGKLTVPNITSSNSVQERPTLFQELEAETSEEQ